MKNRGQTVIPRSKNRPAYAANYNLPRKIPDFALPAGGSGTKDPKWTGVPQFGGWDQKAPVATDYSVVFSQARANRKQRKSCLNRTSLGSQRELVAVATSYRYHQKHPVVKKKKKKILTYINCCIWP